MDIPTGYVVLNNVDTTPSIVQQQQQATTQQPNFLNAAAVIQQQQQAQQQQQTTQSSELQSNEQQQQQQQIFRLQTTENSVSATVTAATVTPTVTASSFHFQPQLVEQQQQQPQHQPQQSNNNVHVVTAKVPPVAQVKRNNAAKATTMSTVTKVQPQQVVNKVLPTTMTQSTQQASKLGNNNKAQQQQQQQAYARNIAAANAAATATATASAAAATAAVEAHITLTPVTKAATPQQSNSVAYTKVSNHTDTPAVSMFVTSVTTTTTTSNINQATTVKALPSVPATVTTAARKTNLIRPITANKAEVKPKVIKTAASTVNKQQQQQQSTQSQLLQQQQQQQQLQQPQQQQQLQTQQAPAQQATKMAMLKPQPQTAQVCLPKPQQQQQPIQQQQQQSQLQAPQFATEPSHNLTPPAVPASTMPVPRGNSNNNGNNSNKLLEYQQPATALQSQHFAEAPVVPQQPYNNAPTTMYNSGGVAPEEQHPPAPHLTNGNMTHSYDCSHQQQQPQLPHTQQIEFNSLSLEQVESFPPPTPQQQQPHEQENSILAAAHTNTNATLASIVNSNSNNSNARCLQYTNSAFGNVNVPTNIVNPLQQTLQYNNNNNNNGGNGNATTTTMGSRPTNRVLPMQQRQEHIVATTPPLQVKPPTGVMPKMSVMNAVDAKCYDSRNAVNSAKIFYEAEVKKDEQMLHMLHSPQHHHQQQQQQVMQMQLHETHQESAIMMKSLSPEAHFVDDSIKCDLDLIETETTLSTTCQQLQEMVHNNLPRYTGTCLVANEKPKELTPTPEEAYALNGHVDALAGSDICEHDGDCMDDMDDDEDDDEEDEDEDDDGFSLKMPTEDDDHDMSDSDEPAVKEKISKILDNLTNEDCADSLATATTAEATNIELNNVSYLSGMPGVSAKMAADTIKYQSGMRNNYITNVSADDTADVAAAATEYITQMAAKMSAHMPNGSLEVIGTNFDLQKLAPKVLPSMAMITNANHNAARQCDEVERAGAQAAPTQEPVMATRKPTPPPPPPQRDPKKVSGPHLLYEIQSEDGFTYKSSSIADIWEKVFEAVQVARRAHGLSPLPEGPLADMAGVQMMGLKTNALKYLIEQLPGVERCTKYTPKYHKRATTNTHTGAPSGGASAAAGNNSALLSATLAGSNIDLNGSLDYASDPDELQENPYDSARCEPYATRSEYDMFSWLASRHRKQPIQVFVQPSDTELIPR